MSYKYDLFISHASEDKDFVRPLAEAIRAQRLAVWYDEFELRPGMGLRESIDQGLLSSRFGLVVLSPAFFAKSWPRWELDGLVQLAHSRAQSVLFPIWHEVGQSEVAQFSPPLANIVAVISRGDPQQTAGEVLRAIRPRPTAVEVAREVLTNFGFPAPGLSDDWWLDAAAWSAPAPGEGTFQEASAWGWWGFPLPEIGETSDAKGVRIAVAAMQHAWQEAAAAQRITQCTSPSRVISFIESQPGLAAAAEYDLDYLLYYAPQLGIPDSAGFLEPLIASVFAQAVSSIRARPTGGAPGWILRDPDLCALAPDKFAGHYFWPMDPAATSPFADVLAWADAAAWIASSASGWLPSGIRDHLREGLSSMYRRMGVQRAPILEILQDVCSTKNTHWIDIMHKGSKRAPKSRFVSEVREVLKKRVNTSRELLDLPESSGELVSRIAHWGVFENFWTDARAQGF